MADKPKIEDNIKSFLEAFSKLGSDEKLYFLAEIEKSLKGKDGNDKKLYLTLIRAAREGKSWEEALSELRRA